MFPDKLLGKSLCLRKKCSEPDHAVEFLKVCVSPGTLGAPPAVQEYADNIESTGNNVYEIEN